MGERRLVETINGGDNSIDSENTNLDRRAIHIHGEMEHNLVEYSKYYSCGHIEISRNNEFAKETNHNRRNFLEIGKQMIETSYTLNLGQLL